MKRTNLKRSFLLSVLSLLLCVSMFVGTTFAWFSETISNQNNRIMAGNLDVELYYKLNAGDAWTELTSTSELFDDEALWEPGYTQVVYFKVENKGTLALKYQLGVNVVTEKTGTNVAGESFKLSDYIEFGVIESDDEVTYATRDLARAAVTSSKIISEGFAKSSELLASDGTTPSDEFVTMVVYMPKTVENEANYKTGTVAPEINLGIELYATQMMNEEDTFGPDYDENAPKTEVATAAELQEVLNKGGYALLTANITAEGNKRFDVPVNTTAAIDLNGYTLTSKDGGGSNTMAIFVDKGAKLTLEDSQGTGKIVSSCYGVYVKQNAQFIMNGGTLEVSGNGVYDMGVCVWNSSFVMNGGTINAKFGVWASNYYKDAGETGLNNCYVKIADAAVVNSTGYADVEYADALDATVIVPDALTTYPTVVSTADELKTGIENLGYVILGEDIDLAATQIEIPDGSEVVIDLNGHKMTGAFAAIGHYAMFTIPNTSSLTVKGEGEVSATTEAAESNRSLALFLNQGKLTLNGGTYNLTDNSVGKTWIIATIVDNRTDSASCDTQLVINGGDYSVGGNAINLFRNYPQQGGKATLTINDGVFHANPDKATTYIWNQESGTNPGLLNFMGGTFDANVVYEDYNGQSDITVAPGVVINPYEGNS